MIPVEERPVYTLKAAPAVPASYDEAIERARALKPELARAGRRDRALRRLPAENVADLLENGLYGLMTPKRFGGSELGSEAMIDVTIELASACPSTGWVHMLWTAHMWLLALFPPESAGGAVEQPEHAGVVGRQHRRRRGARRRAATAGPVAASSRAASTTATGSPRRCRSSAKAREEPARAALAADPARGLRDRRRLVHGRAEGHRQQDHRGRRRLHSRAPHAGEHGDRGGHGAGQQINSHPMYGAISSANFTAAMAAPAVGAARGFLAAFEERLRSKSSTIDDGLTVNMARYAQAAAQVDAVHAVTLQNAQRSAACPRSEVSPRQTARRCRRDQAFAAQTRARRSTCCTKSAAAAACSRARTSSACGATPTPPRRTTA